ncbi:MAG: hypothetical protein EOP84_23125, partial [Verrucomicrobiaceae bacterium]
MQRRTFFHTAGQAIAGTVLIPQTLTSAAAAVTPAHAKDFAFVSAPVLLNPEPESVSLVFAISAPATGWVEYGETEALGQRCNAASEGLLPYESKALRFQLTGLKPGRTYFYRVQAVPVRFETAYKIHRGPAIASEVRSFRTLDPSAATANFTVWNDTHQNKETLRQLIAQHRARPADLLLWNGDVTNDITTEELLIQEYLSPAGEAHADSIPVFFSRGNHDVRGEAARLLSQYAPGLGGAYHYTFRQGPVAALVLDTGEDKPDETPAYAGLNDFASHRAAQRQWLERAIEDPVFKSAPFRIAFMHIPLFWDQEVPENWLKVWGGHNGWICEDGQKQWHDLLEKAGIRFIVSGHTHRYAWFPPNGAHSYGQLIGGGPKPEQATIIRIQADGSELRLTVADLAGKEVFRESFKA